MIVKGISITPDVLLVGLALAAVVIGRGRLFLRDWIPFIGLFLAYELMRGYADNFGASIHVADFVAIDRFLGFGHAAHPDPPGRVPPGDRARTGWRSSSTVFYFLHFPLPLAVGFFLWLRQRRVYYDFVAAIILLSMAAFVTYLILPVGPPWYAADHGLLNGANGQPTILYLKSTARSTRSPASSASRATTCTATRCTTSTPTTWPPSRRSMPPIRPWPSCSPGGRSAGSATLMIGYAACVWFAVDLPGRPLPDRRPGRDRLRRRRLPGRDPRAGLVPADRRPGRGRRDRVDGRRAGRPGPRMGRLLGRLRTGGSAGRSWPRASPWRGWHRSSPRS